jgi:hypothetical protein
MRTLITLGALAIVVGCGNFNSVCITPQSCDRIRPGMTAAEAEQAMGCPPSWYEGVSGIVCDAPKGKQRCLSWVGLWVLGRAEHLRRAKCFTAGGWFS